MFYIFLNYVKYTYFVKPQTIFLLKQIKISLKIRTQFIKSGKHKEKEFTSKML